MRSRRTLIFVLLVVAALRAHLPFHAAAQTAMPPSASAGGFRIAGMVVSKVDGHPLANARVILANTRARQQILFVMTSVDGRFEFLRIPAGKYALTGAHRGFMSASYDQHDEYSTAIVTGAGLDTETLVLKLAPNALISGRVLDEAGEPVRDAMLNLYRDFHLEGMHEIRTFHSAHANDLGEYEMDGLMPGTYFLSVTAQPWYAVHPNFGAGQPHAAVDSSLDVTYPVTYYAEATEPEDASPITIRGGEHLQFDLHLSPVPSLHLTVHVPESGYHQFSFPQLERSTFDGMVPIQAQNRMMTPGVWELFGIPAGKYSVHMIGPDSQARFTSIDLNGETQELDATAGDTTCHLKVSVVSGMPDSTQLTVMLHAKNSFFPQERVDAKGQAEFQNLAPGRYEVQVLGRGNRFSVGRMTAEGATVSGHSITLAANTNASVALSVESGSAEIQGIAKLGDKPFAGAMIVLVPRNPAGNRDLFRRDQSDLDGTFVLHNVIPGAYTVVAIENGWDLDWSQPELIVPYANYGVPVQVANKSGQNLDLSAAVEVQSK